MRRNGMLVVLLCAVMAAVQVRAATDDIPQGMADKAVSGAIDMVTGIVELPMQIVKGYRNGFGMIENEAGSKAVGTVLGIFRGFGHAAGRTSWGAMELFGFWTANAEDNDGVGVPLDAQYAWEEGTQYSIFKPTFAEGVQPIGRKLMRGLADGFLGIAELPGQTIQGINDGETGKGVLQGVWFWFSREVYGFGSVLTCLVPNPEDNPGYAFDSEWPWTALAEEVD